MQRYFSRRVLRQTKLNYHDRLHVLNLESLELRRIKCDIKLCYKIVRGLCDLDCNDFFTFAPYSNTRGHNFKLSGPVCKNNWLLNFFTNRVISYWNFLPAEVVNAESFGTFNAKLNSVDLSKFCILGRALAFNY